jgi:hypothetical protein
MKSMFKPAMIGILAVVLVGVVFVPQATAQCAFPGLNKAGAIQRQSWRGEAQVRSEAFVLASEERVSDVKIAGFWKVKFISEGTPGIPDGAVIDNGFAQWHDDGTEIMNSSRVPATGSFCLGVFQKIGPSSYSLNHFALSFDPAGNFVGPAQIREQVTLNKNADQYEGTFTVDQFDPSGNVLAHITGKVTAARIFVDTPVADVL